MLTIEDCLVSRGAQLQVTLGERGGGEREDRLDVFEDGAEVYVAACRIGVVPGSDSDVIYRRVSES